MVKTKDDHVQPCQW